MLNKLGKLLKYEFRFYFRILPPMYLIIFLLAIAILVQSRLSNNFAPGNFLLILLSGALTIAISVITIILIIQRYMDNFLKDSGYLMFSLPVTVWALLASKTIAALCMILAGFLCITVSSAINTIGTENWKYIFSFIQNNPNDIINSAAAGLSMLLQQICLFYTVITISYLLPKFRNIAAVIMYFIIMSIIGNIVRAMPLIQTTIFTFIFAALFFYITGFLLKRSYNLE